MNSTTFSDTIATSGASLQKASRSSRPFIAVIGSGYWGKNLVRNYHAIGALKLICDRNVDILSQFKAQYPDIETCLDINKCLANPEIQGVVIATPTKTHHLIAREALKYGKHVYVEKPLVQDENDAMELIRIAEKQKMRASA